ncbi:GTPase of the mitochondrial inner membrane that associates with the large ribosomal subunit [Blastocladiella emersonii ATCC 22665]|nr:GTPase of the mitochondrial inner membrane that associates with the large ribosomal subunit [Blastocladiella emersonii ATCC 22665]
MSLAAATRPLALLRTLHRRSAPATAPLRRWFRDDAAEAMSPAPEVAEWAVKRKVTHKLLGKDRHFIDRMRVEVKAGNGGDGCIAFLREAGRPKGPPAGGNGGRGGDVVFVATASASTLRGLRTKYAAPHGINGMGKMMHGKNAQPLVVEVPVGTVVSAYTAPVSDRARAHAAVVDEVTKPFHPDQVMAGIPGEREDILARLKKKNPHEKLMQELLPTAVPLATPDAATTPAGAATPNSKWEIHFDTPGQTHTMVRGGQGGLGNIHFSGTHRSPRERTLGVPGQVRTLQLELKTIADLGLIGMPNAGKSSLLNALSNASSKVADYPFTTLNPFLGTLVWPDAFRATMADIPGLVAGAHRNVGLGHDFLRHVERSRAFVFVVDLSDDPVRDLKTLIDELEKYKPGLTRRPALVVGNKADLAPQAVDGLRNLRAWLDAGEYRAGWTESDSGVWDVVPMAAKYKANVPSLMLKLRALVDALPPGPAAAAAA